MANNSFKDLLYSGENILVDFHAEWCGPCKMMPPILTELKSKMGKNIRIIKIDIDKNQSVANHFNVQSVPTLILFKNGKIVWRNSGVMPATQLYNNITDAIKRLENAA